MVLSRYQFELLSFVAENMPLKINKRFMADMLLLSDSCVMREYLTLLEEGWLVERNGYVYIKDKGLKVLEPFRVKRAVILVAGFSSRMMPESAAECDVHFEKLDGIRNKINGFSQKRPHVRKNLLAYIRSWNLYIGNKKRSLSKEQINYKREALLYEYDNSKNVFVTGGAYKKRDVFPKMWISEGTYLEFEGKKFCVPTQYDKYLKQLYGDYMKLPPKEKQVTHHMFKAYWKN